MKTLLGDLRKDKRKRKHHITGKLLITRKTLAVKGSGFCFSFVLMSACLCKASVMQAG